MIGIYILTNKVNGMKYVGCSLRCVYLRVEEHLSGMAKGCRLIHEAIKEYGRDSFSVEYIDCTLHFPEFIGTHEKNLIKSLNTVTPNGYNIVGGSNGYKSRRRQWRFITIEESLRQSKDELIEMYLNDVPLEVIAERYNMSKSHLGAIFREWGIRKRGFYRVKDKS